MEKNNKKIIIATGGTGGHVLPAVSLANYLNKIGLESFLSTDKRGFKFIEAGVLKMLNLLMDHHLIKKRRLFHL